MSKTHTEKCLVAGIIINSADDLLGRGLPADSLRLKTLGNCQERLKSQDDLTTTPRCRDCPFVVKNN